MDVHTYNAALSACVEDIDRFDRLRSQMRNDKVPVNIANLNIVAHVCEANELYTEAFLVQKDLMRRKPMVPCRVAPHKHDFHLLSCGCYSHEKF